MLEKETEVSKELKFFNKRGRKKCSKNNRIIGLALNASQTRGKRKGGSEVQHWGWRERQQLRLEAEELLQMVLTAANHTRQRKLGVQGGLHQGVERTVRPATVFFHGERRGGGGGQRRRRVHRFKGGVFGKGSKRARERPGGPGAARAAGEPTQGPSMGRGRARSPKGRQRGWGRGPGGWGKGGRGPLTITNRSPFQPPL